MSPSAHGLSSEVNVVPLFVEHEDFNSLSTFDHDSRDLECLDDLWSLWLQTFRISENASTSTI